MNKPSPHLPLWIFSFGLFPLGLGGFALGSADIIAGLHSRAWNEVPGVVLSARLETSMFAPRQPEIRYGYSVGASQYVSNRIWPGKTFAYMPELSLGASQRIVSRFVEGSHVPVYVNSENPLDVALVRGPRKAAVWMGIFTFFLSLGFWSPMALGLLLERKLSKSK